jgi:nitrite reductase (NADH) small subunit
MRHELFALDELGLGQMRRVTVGELPLVVIRHPDGSVRAFRDHCPHYGARLSYGRVQPKTVGDVSGFREFSKTEFVVRCPWHNYEYDLDTGVCPADARKRLRAYNVFSEDGKVLLELADKRPAQ